MDIIEVQESWPEPHQINSKTKLKNPTNANNGNQ